MNYYIMSQDGDFYRGHHTKWNDDENWTFDESIALAYESIEKAVEDVRELKDAALDDMNDCTFCIVDENYRKVNY